MEQKSLTNKYKLVPLGDIQVPRDQRQRRVVDTGNLKESIARVGVLQPIIVTKGMVLVAGERRLQSCRELGLATIPVRFAEDLPEIEAQLIELEENLKRENLSWRDQTLAIQRIHDIYGKLDPTWTQQRTGAAIGLTPGIISIALRVAKDIESPRIAQAATMLAAYNILSRVDERKVGDALSEILEAGDQALMGGSLDDAGGAVPQDGPVTNGAPVTQQGPSTGAPPMPPATGNAPATPAAGPANGARVTLDPDATILHGDFLEWVETYSGPRFNFIHCDFPYGIEAFGGKMSGRDKWQQYKDSPDVYWQLLGGLCHNLDRIMAHSGHLMFWFSMEHYTKTMEFFQIHAPDLEIQTFPLIWMKSDNVGILPDPARGPRRVYETALIGTRADRKILKPVANAYAAPTDKQHHQSTKPMPVLRHFFQMFVDRDTRLLDPTCGSGSAIRVAEEMGARCLGLEIDQEHCANAQSALRSARALRKATEA